MLKRIFTIALITGAGQLFIVFALKYMSQHSSPEQVKTIGQIDSLVLFMINVIALGLQPAAMRNLALTNHWKDEYAYTQSARLVLSFFIAAFALLAFIDQYYLAFLIAPLLALSGDYALYGRGMAVKGALIASVRAIIPFLLVLILMWQNPTLLPWIYLAGLVIAYVITNTFISYFLKTTGFPKIKFSNLKLYIKTLPLGLVSLSLYFIGMGVILIAQYLYLAPVLATVFIGLKFYIIYKGVLRTLHQAFFKEMISEATSLKIDQLSAIAGTVFFGSLLIFPGSFIRFFFGVQYINEESFFVIIGGAGFIYSLFLSMATRSMLLKKDRAYTITSVIAALVTIILVIIFAYFYKTANSIAISILAGELVWMFGLLRITATLKDIQPRLTFALQCFLFLLIPLGLQYLLGDLLWVYATSFVLFSIIQLFLHFRKFRALPQY